jgi:hypothetical protein
MLKRNDTARFDLLAYLEGLTTAEGVFEDRKGRARRRFTVELNGRSQAGALVVDENFVFDDGERQHRCWTLMRRTENSFSGTCADSVGEARGRLADGVAYLESTLRLKVGSRQIAMDFDDAFYEAGPGLVLNRSYVSKWGIGLGRVLILFRKA